MSYRTTFTLEAAASPGLTPSLAHAKCLRKIIEEMEDDCYLLDGKTSLKWYSFEADCKDISAKYPEMAFKISGHGERLADVWWMDFYNGESTDYWHLLTSDLTLSLKTVTLYLDGR